MTNKFNLSNISLENIFQKTGTDKFDHNYHEIYEKLFRQHREKDNLKFLEIGTRAGLGIQSFNLYFYNNPSRNFYCLDIHERHLAGLRHMFNCFRCDQGNVEELNLFLEHFDFPKFDIVIDDGSHITNDQIKSLSVIFKQLKSNGIYIIEDLFLLIDDKINKFHDSKEMNMLEIINFYMNNNYFPVEDKNGKANPMSPETIEYLNHNVLRCYIYNINSKENIISGGGPGKRPVGIFVKK